MKALHVSRDVMSNRTSSRFFGQMGGEKCGGSTKRILSFLRRLFTTYCQGDPPTHRRPIVFHGNRLTLYWQMGSENSTYKFYCGLWTILCVSTETSSRQHHGSSCVVSVRQPWSASERTAYHFPNSYASWWPVPSLLAAQTTSRSLD